MTRKIAPAASVSHILLADSERSTLDELASSPGTPSRVATRAQIVLALARGLNTKEVAETLGVSRPTVTLWRQRYAESGVAGLQDRQQTANQGQEVERLLDAAQRMMSERGFCATRITDIAAEAGVSPATVLYHLNSREEVLLRSMIHASQQAAASMRRELAAAPSDPLARVRAFLRRVLPRNGNQRDEFLLELDLLAHVREYPSLIPLWETYQEESIREIANIIDDGVRAGTFRTRVSTEDLSNTIVAVVDGLGYQIAAGSARMDVDGVQGIIARYVADQLGVATGLVLDDDLVN